MELTKRETEVVDYLRKEAAVFRKAAEPKHMSHDAKMKYLGMSDALTRAAREVLEGEHRA